MLSFVPVISVNFQFSNVTLKPVLASLAKFNKTKISANLANTYKKENVIDMHDLPLFQEVLKGNQDYLITVYDAKSGTHQSDAMKEVEGLFEERRNYEHYELTDEMIKAPSANDIKSNLRNYRCRFYQDFATTKSSICLIQCSMLVAIGRLFIMV